MSTIKFKRWISPDEKWKFERVRADGAMKMVKSRGRNEIWGRILCVCVCYLVHVFVMIIVVCFNNKCGNSLQRIAPALNLFTTYIYNLLHNHSIYTFDYVFYSFFFFFQCTEFYFIWYVKMKPTWQCPRCCSILGVTITIFPRHVIAIRNPLISFIKDSALEWLILSWHGLFVPLKTVCAPRKRKIKRTIETNLWHAIEESTPTIFDSKTMRRKS